MNLVQVLTHLNPQKVSKKNQRYAQIFTHRFPQFNFELLTNVISGYLVPTLPIWPLEQCFPFQEDQNEGGPSYGMMSTHTQPTV